jgi:alpha-glucosidase
VNFGDQPREVALPGGLRIEVASDSVGEGAPFAGRLDPAQAVILA